MFSAGWLPIRRKWALSRAFSREDADDAVAGRELAVASFGIGDSYGLYRWNGGRHGDGVQVALSAAVFAQFDLGQSNFDLLNADYNIGVPITIRFGWFSTRLRVYHQSSHLGDGFLEEEPTPEMLATLSFYSAEGILSVDAGPLRLYGGGEYLFLRTPEDLAVRVLHGGAELRPGFRIIPLGSLGGLRLVAAGDVKSSKEQDWAAAWSVRGGLEYVDGDVSGRRWSILAEFYDGPVPYGQFFREKIRFAGLGIHFGGF